METITITIPAAIAPGTFKRLVEGNLRQNAKHECDVTWTDSSVDENIYEITAGSPEVFYLIGMTVSEVIRKISR